MKMMTKIKKIIDFAGILLENPSLINITLNENSVLQKKFKQKYGNFVALPQIEIKDLAHNDVSSVESFLMDGSSLITDLQLLATLAAREDVNSYFEIGTWRGESVYNVAKQIQDCTTMNLSKLEMKEMGWDSRYAEQHGILSTKNSEILHLEGNTKAFDFASLNKKYDLIFIDGDHSYDMVLNDTKKVFKHLLHENSIVVWHDYAYSPQKIRYEVFHAILDGTGKENHQYLYHVKNTLCGVFYRGDIDTTIFDDMEVPGKIYHNTIISEKFS